MNETKTFIGESALILGQVEGDEDLHVAGRIEGAISLSESLYVESSGVIQGDVTARSVVLHGMLVGNIDASESVQIGSGGRMIGDICAPEVVVHQGAALRGQIDMGDFDLDIPSPAPAPKRSVENVRPIEPRRADVSPITPTEPQRRSTPPKRPSDWGTSTPVSRAPAPRPSMSQAPASSPRPVAPPPKLRNIGRAKARKTPR